MFSGVTIVDYLYKNDTFGVSTYGDFLNKVKQDPYVEHIGIPMYESFGFYWPEPDLDALSNMTNVKQVLFLLPTNDTMDQLRTTSIEPEAMEFDVTEYDGTNGSDFQVSLEFKAIIIIRDTIDGADVALPTFNESSSYDIGQNPYTIKLTDLVKYLCHKFGPVTRLHVDEKRVNLVAIRSYHDGLTLKKQGTNYTSLKYNMNKVNGSYYDSNSKNYRQFVDKLYMFWYDGNGMWQVKEFNMTTLHGYRENTRYNSQGTGIVKEGQHINSHFLGLHGISKNFDCSSGSRAVIQAGLRQQTQMWAYRDSATDGYYALSNLTRGAGGSSLAYFNVHSCFSTCSYTLSGGSTTKYYQRSIASSKRQASDYVKGYSLGCQTLTVPSYNDWTTEFVAPLKEHTRRYKYAHNNNRGTYNYSVDENDNIGSTSVADFTYILIEEWDLVKFMGDNGINGFNFAGMGFEAYAKTYMNIDIV